MIRKVFITKYALTSGIIECDLEVEDDLKSCYGKPPGFFMATGFYGNDFYLTKEDTLKQCEVIRNKKIDSLKKQISKLEKMSFSI